MPGPRLLEQLRVDARLAQLRLEPARLLDVDDQVQRTVIEQHRRIARRDVRDRRRLRIHVGQRGSRVTDQRRECRAVRIRGEIGRRAARDDRARARRAARVGEPEQEREVRARGIAHHRDPVRIDGERAGASVQPRERGAHVFELRGIAVLGCEPVVDVVDGIAGLDEAAREARHLRARAALPAPAVDHEHRGKRPGAVGAVEVADARVVRGRRARITHRLGHRVARSLARSGTRGECECDRGPQQQPVAERHRPEANRPCAASARHRLATPTESH
jgi:hypothetical protein